VQVCVKLFYIIGISVLRIWFVVNVVILGIYYIRERAIRYLPLCVSLFLALPITWTNFEKFFSICTFCGVILHTIF